MEIAFGKPDGAAPPPVIPVEATVTPLPTITQAPAATAASVATPTVQAETAVVPFSPGGALAQNEQGFFDGGFVPAFQDVMLPRLNIAQNIGDIGKMFAPGSLVWDAQNSPLCLWHPPVLEPGTGKVLKPSPDPVYCCVLDFQPPRYVEKVQGGSGMIVNTVAEVTANGGTLSYKEWEAKRAAGMRYFQTLADAIIAIRRPSFVADDDMTFNFVVGQDKYVLGLFAMKGASYTAACKGGWFQHRSVGCLRMGGYPSWHYYLTTRRKQFDGDKEAWVPVPIPAVKSSQEFLAFARSLMKRPQQ